MPQIKVIISGGGTGGHIFPAIAIADAVRKQRPDAQFLFVGAKGKMEMEKVPAAGYKIEGLWISGLQRSLTLKNLAFPFKLISSSIKAKKLVKEFNPNVAVGTGGYASGPTLRAAMKRDVPALLQEQNSLPGMTNRILSRKASKVCVAYPGMEKYFPQDKIVLSGNPVRSSVIQIEGKKERGLEHFGLKPDKKTLLVVGGSLGSRSVNNALIDGLDEIAKSDYQLIWQTGKLTHEQVKSAVEKSNAQNIKVCEFISEMDLAYAAADLIVSRAGAIAVSEISLVQKPVILVPFPYAAEDHQAKNAMALVNRNAALMIRDKDLGKELISTISTTISDDNKLENLARNIAGLAVHDSADIIANEVIKLAEK